MGMLLCSAGCAVLQHTRWHGVSHGGTASCMVTGTRGSNRRHAVPRAMAQGRSSYRALGPALVCTAALVIFHLGPLPRSHQALPTLSLTLSPPHGGGRSPSAQGLTHGSVPVLCTQQGG